jgi:hypothetical protein
VGFNYDFKAASDFGTDFFSFQAGCNYSFWSASATFQLQVGCNYNFSVVIKLQL